MRAGGGTYRLSEAQVKAILDLRLHRLTALGRDEIGDELKELAIAIEEYLSILADRVKLYGVMPTNCVAVRELSPRRASPRSLRAWDGIDDEDLIEREDMVVTVTMDGYIKRTPLSTFRAQNRGGKGRAGMATKEEDAVRTMFVTSAPTRRCCSSPPPARSIASRCGAARRRPRHARPPDRQPAASARQGRDHRHRSALPEDEAEWGKLSRRVRHRQGQRPPQFDGRVRQHPVERQVRDALR
jgi:DNA gyrase subunit A